MNSKMGKLEMGGKIKKTICFDFDGVISSYDGWKGFDVFGEPNQKIIDCMKKLHAAGYHLVIFTTRQATQKMVDWLELHDVPYHDINKNRHQPTLASNKPIYHCFVDDRAVNYHGQDTELLLKDIMSLLEKDV